MKILITTSSFGKYDSAPLNKLKGEGFEVIMNLFGRTLSAEEAVRLYSADIDGVIAGTEKISSEVIDNAKNLKAISRCGIGLDNVDIEAAIRRKIKVFNTPEPVVDAVAELTMGIILSLLKNIALCDREMHSGIWKKEMGCILRGKTLGIVGLGNIGKRLAELVQPFGLRILAYDKKIDNGFAVKLGIKYIDLDSLFSESDIVSLHLPLTTETNGLCNRCKIGRMKPEAFLINTSRAAIIDEDALVDALKHKKIKGAGLDVFGKEPYNGPLTKLDNVILTPHIGSYAKEARIRMEIEAVENLLKGLGNA